MYLAVLVATVLYCSVHLRLVKLQHFPLGLGSTLSVVATLINQTHHLRSKSDFGYITSYYFVCAVFKQSDSTYLQWPAPVHLCQSVCLVQPMVVLVVVQELVRRHLTPALPLEPVN